MLNNAKIFSEKNLYCRELTWFQKVDNILNFKMLYM
jgi:hypothetical protein